MSDELLASLECCTGLRQAVAAWGDEQKLQAVRVLGQPLRAAFADYLLVEGRSIASGVREFAAATVEQRRGNAQARSFYLLGQVRSGSLGANLPCELCFCPTGNWCEICDDAARAVCTECEFG